MKRTFIILFFLALVFNCANVYAIEVDICEYSQEFIEWVKLSDEEKEKIEVVPAICKTEKKSSIINNITANSFARESVENFPNKYSLVSEGQVSPVRNQMQTGTCWAFTSNEMVESNLLKKDKLALSFSSRHIEYYTSRNFSDGINYDGLNRIVDTGGNFFMSTSYYKNNYGPILETDMPFENNMNILKLSSIQNKKQAVDVNSSFVLPNGESGCTNSIKSIIKSHLMNYGAVGTMINMQKVSTYYNDKTHSYYYNGTGSVNHAVTIVGWDDDYSVSNFTSTNKPSTAGAWLVKNSYGTSFGDNGYFYVSYNDVRVCKTFSGIYDIDFDFPEKLYTYDKFGYNSSLLFSNGGTSSYMATKFVKPLAKEYLNEITIGSYGYALVDLYVVPTNKELSIANAINVGSMTIPYGGYSTFKLEQPIELTDTTFYIIAKYTYLNSAGPAVSLNIPGSPWDVVTANLGESYISLDGRNYTDLISALGEQANAAITAGTVSKLEKLTTDTSKNYKLYNNKTTTETIKVTTVDIEDNSNLTVKVLKASDKTDKTSLFTISNNKVVSNVSNINISAKTTATVGDYIVVISFNGKKVEVNLNVSKYEYVTSILIDDATIEVGKDLQLIPVVQPSTAANKTLKMISGDTTIFTVKDGKIHGVKAGNAKLIIEATDGSNVKKEITVTVFQLFKNDSKYESEEHYIVNIAEKSDYEKVISNINKTSSDTISIINLNGKTITSGYIGTGFKLKKSTSGSISEYIFVVSGDTNGDGQINSADLLRVRQHLLKTIELKNEYFKASDINKDNTINSADLLRIRQHLLGMLKIE